VTATVKDKSKEMKLQALMVKRLHQEGWDTVFEFVRKSGVPYSHETVSKVFNGREYKNTRPVTIAVILKYLNVPTNEIRDILINYTGDKDIHTLLPTTTEQAQALSVQEEAWLEIYRTFRRSKVEALPHLNSMLMTCGAVAGIDLEPLLAKI
jgi:hypothetical protein